MSIYDDFISKFPDGIRANLFKVYIDNLEPMFVKSMSIPGVTLNSYELFYNQFVKHYITSQDFDPITMYFYLDNIHIKPFQMFMLEWKNQIVEQSTGLLGYRDEYIKDIIIDVLNAENKIILTTKLLNSFPVNIESLAFDYDSVDTFITLPVTFRFENVEFIK